jgi:Tol biopolymer transport system component
MEDPATSERVRKRDLDAAFIVAAAVLLIASAVFLATAQASFGATSPWSGRFVVTTHRPTIPQAPDWMPDGRHVVFHDDLEDGNGEQIYEARFDGTGRKRCLTCGLEGPNMVPVVQPGGKHILFHSWYGHNMTIGAPGFGGMGSDVWVMRSDGTHRCNLTRSMEGHDNFHAYWSPDGRRIVWTALNWNFVTENGNGKSDIRVADVVFGGKRCAHLAHVRVVRPGNGHWYETQWWAPDGSGFLYTESHGTAINNELYFMDLTGPRPRPVRLTNDPAWDEQAIFTPDMKRVIFMSTRDHPGAFNDWASLATALGLPAGYDYALILPVFEFGFLQPLFEQSNDLYELNLKTRHVRRLTHDGDQGWIIPEFAWSPDGRRLLWTESKYNEGLRIDQNVDLAKEVADEATFLMNPPQFGQKDIDPGGPSAMVVSKTRIGRYVQP